VDLTTHYAGLNLRLMQRRRWKTSIQANYSSNLASQLLALAGNSLAAPGTVVPDANALVPFATGISSFNINALTSATLSHGFGVFAALEHSAILNGNQQSQLSSSYTTATAGVNYVRRYTWGSVSGEYSREYGAGSVTGEAGTIQGQNYVASAQRGKSGGLVFEAIVHGSNQSVHNSQPISNNSISAEGSVADRVYGDFTARIGGGYNWGTITNNANEFRTNGYSARLGIEHPRLQISAGLNDSLSNSLPIYGQLLGSLGVASPLLIAPLQVIPSDFRSMNFTVHAMPVKKLEISALWTRSRQHLDGFLTNDFEILNVWVTYHFRRIKIDAGFIRANQVFADYPYSLHERFYVRFSRTMRIL